MPALLGVFGLASAFDALAVMYGAVAIFGSGPAQWAVGAVLMVLVLGVTLNSAQVLTEKDTLGTMLKGLWSVAILVNLGCAYVAFRELLVGGSPDMNERGLLIGLTALMCGAPVFFSLLFRRFRKQDSAA